MLQSSRLAALFATLTLAPVAASADVILYQHCQFGGYAIRIHGEGLLQLAELERLGVRNDDVSSVQVEGPGVYEVILYEHNRGEGRQYRVTGEPTDECLTDANFNDVLSSVEIRLISKE